MALVELLAGSPGGRRRLQLKSPATLDPIGEIEGRRRTMVRRRRARKAQPAWAEAGRRARAICAARCACCSRTKPSTPRRSRAKASRTQVLATELVSAS
jgi:hypothetical protein